MEGAHRGRRVNATHAALRRRANATTLHRASANHTARRHAQRPRAGWRIAVAPSTEVAEAATESGGGGSVVVGGGGNGMGGGGAAWEDAAARALRIGSS